MSQSPVNIVYPIHGRNYPIIDPACKIQSAYFTASFGATCEGGPHEVKWGVDSIELGRAQYYDEFSAQFTWKLPAGKHTFFAATQCGDAQVDFTIS